MNIRFARDAWTTDELTYAYSYRFSDRPVFTQFDDHIENKADPDGPGGYEYISVLSRKQYAVGARITTHCSFEDDGAPLIVGKTEWAVLNLDTMKPVPLTDVYPEGLVLPDAPEYDAPFVRVTGSLARADALGVYTVRSTDIDLGGHMNNAAYLRALFGVFSNAELAAMEIHEIDAGFRASCFEGETLQFYKKESGGALDLRIARGEETVLLARIV